MRARPESSGRPSRRSSPTAPTSNLAAVGRAYAPVLATTYADAWESAATKLEQGGAVGDCQAQLQDRWKAARTAAANLRMLRRARTMSGLVNRETGVKRRGT
jgi:hypothetical protein